jgi:hypothetical protein
LCFDCPSLSTPVCGFRSANVSACAMLYCRHYSVCYNFLHKQLDVYCAVFHGSVRDGGYNSEVSFSFLAPR